MSEKNWVGGKYKYLVLSKQFCVLLAKFAILLANTSCSLSQQLSSVTLQLGVVHTARMFTMERFIEFYFELGLKKYSA